MGIGEWHVPFGYVALSCVSYVYHRHITGGAIQKQGIRSYRDLQVWQRGINLTEQIYSVTRLFPEEERFGIVAQLRRAAVSIPSNIAEGWGRATRGDYVHFLRIARGSLVEVETQVIIARRLGYMGEQEQNAVLKQTTIVSKMLLKLIRALQK